MKKLIILTSLLIAPSFLAAADPDYAAKQIIGKEIAAQLKSAPKSTTNYPLLGYRAKKSLAKRDSQREKRGDMRDEIERGMDEYENGK
jgi:hypothetical protein